MSSKFRTGFIICSENRRRLYFKRSRNGTFSTTATSYRSSTLRNSTTTNDGYRVYFRQRNNSLIKNFNESNESSNANYHQKESCSSSGTSTTSSPSHNTYYKNYYTRKDKENFNEVIRIDEVSETDDYENKNTNSIYDNYPTIRNVPRCYSVTEEVIHLHEKFVKDLNVEESFV